MLTKLDNFPINQISTPILEVGVAKKLMINNIKELLKDFNKNNYISNFLEK